MLKHLGAVAGVGAVLQGASAFSDKRRETGQRDLHAQSLARLEATNSPQQQREFLRAQEFGVASVQNTYSIAPEDRSGAFPRRDLEIHLSLYNKPDTRHYIAELAFQFEWDPADTGAHPWDIASIGGSSDWEYYWNNVYKDIYARGPTTIWYQNATHTDFNVDDANQSEGVSDWYYCGIHITPTSREGANREVYGSYTHTWNSNEISGVSVSPTGISVSVSEQTNSWSTDTERDGTVLRVDQADAEPVS